MWLLECTYVQHVIGALPMHWRMTMTKIHNWRKRRFRADWCPSRGSSSPLRCFEPARVRPNTSYVGRMAGPAPLTDFSQYASSPGRTARCYAELAVSSRLVAETTSSSHCTYPQRDGEAEWAWVEFDWANKSFNVEWSNITLIHIRIHSLMQHTVKSSETNTIHLV